MYVCEGLRHGCLYRSASYDDVSKHERSCTYQLSSQASRSIPPAASTSSGSKTVTWATTDQHQTRHNAAGLKHRKMVMSTSQKLFLVYKMFTTCIVVGMFLGSTHHLHYWRSGAR